VTATFALRQYQREAIDAVLADWCNGVARPTVVLPTAAGKTVIFAHMIREIAACDPRRILVLAHTEELLRQAMKKIRSVAPELSVGMVKAHHSQIGARVIVASVQTLRNEKRRAALHNVGTIIVDECHHAVAATYMGILKHFGALDETPRVNVVGFTATLVRADTLKLSDVWQKVAYTKTISWMIRNGYLVDVRGKRIVIDRLHLENVKRSGGDFQSADLGAALTSAFAPEIVAERYAEFASDRAGVLFAPTVAAAEEFAGHFEDKGITSGVIHGGMTDSDRRLILKRGRRGDIQVTHNCMVLTEGFDNPALSCVVVARPTRSSGLYVQMVGRGLRVDPDRPYAEQDCLVLDVSGSNADMGLASLVDLSEKRIRPEDDISLTDLEDGFDIQEEEEERQAAERVAMGWAEGKTEVKDFDPLADSRVAWNKTIGGVSFATAGTKQGGVYVFAIPRGDDTFDAMWCTQNPRMAVKGTRGGVLGEREPLSVAVLKLENFAQDHYDSMVSTGAAVFDTLHRRASWRRKAEPTTSQRAQAERMNIEIPTDATKADVSDLIESRMASQRIDSIVDYFAKKWSE
jgi:superfamily II DNA or RNA helicase